MKLYIRKGIALACFENDTKPVLNSFHDLILRI